MREIKFRGKHMHLLRENQKLDGVWVYGYLKAEHYINSPELGGELVVDPKTVGQYTGLKGKNGMGLTEVFEGDIISEDGILKGNIYENDKRETDIVVPQLGTKDWETTYKEIVVRGYDYSE